MRLSILDFVVRSGKLRLRARCPRQTVFGLFLTLREAARQLASERRVAVDASAARPYNWATARALGTKGFMKQWDAVRFAQKAALVEATSALKEIPVNCGLKGTAG